MEWLRKVIDTVCTKWISSLLQICKNKQLDGKKKIKFLKYLDEQVPRVNSKCLQQMVKLKKFCQLAKISLFWLIGKIFSISPFVVSIYYLHVQFVYPSILRIKFFFFSSSCLFLQICKSKLIHLVQTVRYWNRLLLELQTEMMVTKSLLYSCFCFFLICFKHFSHCRSIPNIWELVIISSF